MEEKCLVVDITSMEEKSNTKFAKLETKTEKECTVLVIRTTGKSSTGTSKVTGAARIKITRPNKTNTGTDNKGLEDTAKFTGIPADKKGNKEPAILTGIPSGIIGIEDTAKPTGTGIPAELRSDTLPITNKENQDQTAYRHCVRPEF
jgi:hypothetical protein